MTKNKIEFNTCQYELSHRKTPRGYGSWAFCPVERYSEATYLTSTVWKSGTYQQAKKLAVPELKAMAESQGFCGEMIVCP